MFLHLVIGLSALKLLLLPCYTSTDFEVHRNWLAITHSLPLNQWYVEATSEWTLDYPPFFAWFEWTLSSFASLLNIDNKEMLQVENLNHKSEQTMLFQRLSVIFTDLVLALGVKVCCLSIKSKQQNDLVDFLPILVLTNAGLFIVDHMHFQYNGFLLGILLLSIGCMMSEWYLSSAFFFASLLNFKHIYIYSAPAYFVYLLSTYCRQGQTVLGISWPRLASLAFIVIAVFGLSFGPFILHGQLVVVLQRLFPFKRGLTHAYWAPNFWAIYNFVDRVSIFVFKKVGIDIDCESTFGASTSGLVKDTVHCVLPGVPPIATFVLTLAAMLPIMWKLWQSKNDSIQFLRAVILCNFASFVFGWHVHEKAILLVTIPMSILAIMSPYETPHFIVLSTLGNFSLFPLLYEDRETVIKCLLTVWNFVATLYIANQRRKNSQRPLRFLQKTLLFLHAFVFLLCQSLPVLYPTMQFLPLLIYSIFCSIGILYEFCQMYAYYMKVGQ